MGEYYTTVRLTAKGAEVRLGQENFTMSRQDGIGTGHACPMAYMAGALGSWIVLTLSAVADHKKMAMEKLKVQIGCMTADGFSSSTHFTIEIDFGGGLTQREAAILLNSARSCEVSKIMAGKVDFNYLLSSGQ